MIVLVVLIIIGVLAVIAIFYDGTHPYWLTVRVATYGSSSYISEIEIDEKGQLVAMTHNDVIGKHSPYPLKTVGSIEYYVSIRFSVWARQELAKDYNHKNKGWKKFNCPVMKDGKQLTYVEYVNATNSKMRSRKNPTISVWYEESGPPNNTMIKHTEYIKL